MKNMLKILSLTIVMFGVIPSVFAQGFWQRLGQAVLGVAAGAAEGYVGSTLNDEDRKAWNEISNDINNGLGLDNNYVNAGNQFQEGKTTDAVVNMGVTAASNSGNQTLITVSKTVQVQNDYINNVSSGMDQKTAQDAAARQLSDVLLDDMEARERIADEKRRQERIAAENRNEYNSSSNTYTNSSNTSSNTQYSTPSNTQYNAHSRTESKGISSANTYSNMPQNHYRDKQDELLAEIADLTKEYNSKKEEYQQLVNRGASSVTIDNKKDELNVLSQRIEDTRQSLEKEIDKRENNLVSSKNDYSPSSMNEYFGSRDYRDKQDELLAEIGDLTKEYNSRKEEYQQLVNRGASSVTLQNKKDELNVLSQRIENARQSLEKEINKRENNLVSSKNDYSSSSTNEYSGSRDYRDKQDELLAEIGDLTKEYNSRKEEYQQLVNRGASSVTLQNKKDELNVLSQRIEYARQSLEKEINKRENNLSNAQHTGSQNIGSKTNNLQNTNLQNNNSDEQAELRATLSDMTMEYWEKNEEYKQLVANGTSSLILRYKKEALDTLSELIAEVRELLDK